MPSKLRGCAIFLVPSVYNVVKFSPKKKKSENNGDYSIVVNFIPDIDPCIAHNNIFRINLLNLCFVI